MIYNFKFLYNSANISGSKVKKENAPTNVTKTSNNLLINTKHINELRAQNVYYK